MVLQEQQPTWPSHRCMASTSGQAEPLSAASHVAPASAAPPAKEARSDGRATEQSLVRSPSSVDSQMPTQRSALGKVLDSGLLSMNDIHSLAQVSRFFNSTVRQRVKAVKGEPHLLHHLSRFPNVSKATIDFNDPFFYPSSPSPSDKPLAWCVKGPAKPPTRNHLHALTVRVQAHDIYRRYNCYQYHLVNDVFAYIQPFVTPTLNHLHLSVGFHVKALTSSIPILLNTSPLVQLLHLTVSASSRLGANIDLVWSAIDQDKLPLLKSLTLGSSGYQDRDDPDVENTTTMVRKLLLGLNHLPELTSLSLYGDRCEYAEGSSPFCCLLEAKGMDLTRITLAVDPAMILKDVPRFFITDDSTWGHQAFGAAMLESLRNGNKYELQSKDAVLSGLENALERSPDHLHARFLCGILACGDLFYSEAVPFAKYVDTREVDGPHWESLFAIFGRFFDHLATDAGAGDRSTCLPVLLKWLSGSVNGPSDLVRKHLFQHHPKAAATFLGIWHEDFTRRGRVACGTRDDVSRMLIDALYHSVEREVIREATGSDVTDLCISLVREKGVDDRLGVLLYRLSQDQTLDLTRMVDRGVGEEATLLFLRSLIYITRRTETIPQPEHGRWAFHREPSLRVMVVDELLRVPSRLFDVLEIMKVLMEDDDLKPYLMDRLLENDCWNCLWKVIPMQLPYPLSKKDKLTGRMLTEILQVAHSRHLEGKTMTLACDKKTAFRLAELVGLGQLVHGGMKALVDWLIKLLWGSPQAYLEAIINDELLPRCKNARSCKRMNNQLIEHLIMASWAMKERQAGVEGDGGDSSLVASIAGLGTVVDVMRGDLVDRFGKVAKDHLRKGQHGILIKALAYLFQSNKDFVRLVLQSKEDINKKGDLLANLVDTYQYTDCVGVVLDALAEACLQLPQDLTTTLLGPRCCRSPDLVGQLLEMLCSVQALSVEDVGPLVVDPNKCTIHRVILHLHWTDFGLGVGPLASWFKTPSSVATQAEVLVKTFRNPCLLSPHAQGLAPVGALRSLADLVGPPLLQALAQSITFPELASFFGRPGLLDVVGHHPPWVLKVLTEEPSQPLVYVHFNETRLTGARMTTFFRACLEEEDCLQAMVALARRSEHFMSLLKSEVVRLHNCEPTWRSALAKVARLLGGGQ